VEALNVSLTIALRALVNRTHLKILELKLKLIVVCAYKTKYWNQRLTLILIGLKNHFGMEGSICLTMRHVKRWLLRIINCNLYGVRISLILF
jgi:hypothetical protein